MNLEEWERFFNWTLSIKPSWAGMLVWCSAVMAPGAIFLALFVATDGWASILILVVVVHAWIKALFFQGDDR